MTGTSRRALGEQEPLILGLVAVCAAVVAASAAFLAHPQPVVQLLGAAALTVAAGTAGTLWWRTWRGWSPTQPLALLYTTLLLVLGPLFAAMTVMFIRNPSTLGWLLIALVLSVYGTLLLEHRGTGVTTPRTRWLHRRRRAAAPARPAPRAR